MGRRGSRIRARFALAVLVGAMTTVGLADARCMSFHVMTYPAAGQALPVNGRVVFDGRAHAAELAATMKDRAPRLVAGDERIPLEVSEVLAGDFTATQAVLVPKRALTAGKTYALVWTGREGDHANAKTTNGTLRWAATGTPDTTAPAWSASPSLAGGDRHELGCGPVANTVVSVAATDDRVALLFRVDVTSAGRAPVSFLTEAKDGAVLVGHGMCSGPVRLVTGTTYEATLTAVDLAGNASTPAKALRFTAP